MEVTPELLKKYAQGKCSKEESALVEAWMESSDEGVETLVGVPFTDKLDQRLRSNLRRATSNKILKKEAVPRIKTQWLVAASLTLLIGLGLYLFMANYGTRYETGAGELMTVTLADGSMVTLNSMSQLDVPTGFDVDNRTLTLQGEAFFEVARDTLHPFVIETENSRTVVLGTKFNLSAYQNEGVTLSLKEGKVSFTSIPDKSIPPLIVLPNEEVRLQDGELVKNTIDVSFSSAWMEKRLVFRSQKFKQVVRELERFYGLTIKINKKGLENRLYRGNHDNPSLDEILKSMAFVLKFNYKMEDGTLIVY